MNVKEPPQPALILATSVNVEESRAKRLQRQQSRFRDRGGIFVPSNRNFLADILLGKASPLKKNRRSPSVSPRKGNSHSTPSRSKPPSRKNLTKNGLNLSNTVKERQTSELVTNGKSKFGKEKASKNVTEKKPKNSRANNNKPSTAKKVTSLSKSSEKLVKPAPGNSAFSSSERVSSKQAVKRETTKTKTRAASKAAFDSSVNEFVESPERVDPYSGMTDEDYTPPDTASRRKKTTNKKSHNSSVTRKTSKLSKNASKPLKTLPTAPSAAYKPVTHLSNIAEEEEKDEDCTPNKAPHKLSKSEIASAQTDLLNGHNKKRNAQEAEIDQKSLLPAKKLAKEKSSHPDLTRGSGGKGSKRSHENPDADDEGNERKKKRTKTSKKVDDEDDEVGPSTKPTQTKPSKPLLPPSSRPASKRKENRVLSEQKVQAIQSKPITKRGPPLWVLEKLKKSQPHICDNDPDPIDFLS